MLYVSKENIAFKKKSAFEHIPNSNSQIKKFKRAMVTWLIVDTFCDLLIYTCKIGNDYDCS